MHRLSPALALIAAAVALGPAGAPAGAAEVTAPVLRKEVPAGHGSTTPLRATRTGRHRVDGRLSDWRGRSSGYGGTSLYSSGELVYQDHIFDAYGADDGEDVRRLSAEEPAAQLLPETYRIDGAAQYLPGEFGIPTPGYNLSTNFGDLEHQDEADLAQFRMAAGASDLWLLARTTTMGSSPKTALLVLIDSRPGSAARDVPFASGIRSSRADYALLFTPSGAQLADLASGGVRPLDPRSSAFNPGAYTNAIEARVPRALVGATGSRFSVAAATGIAEGGRLKAQALGPNLANVAFREREPVRNWWEKQQAFALHGRGIDEFFKDVDTGRLRRGANEAFRVGPGYWDRVFASDPRVSQERGQNGALQHYGIYLPSRYTPARKSPLQFWFHFRGGTAHIAATLVPGIMQDMGETPQTIVVSPSGRGTSRWYVGVSHVDFKEVWADVHRRFNVDRDRTYTAGHSMGGWASFLMPILYPDYWAASFPASAAITQGAWTGVDFAGCDQLEADGTTPCYTGANGGNPRVQLTTPLLDNLREVPVAMFHGVGDELAPFNGIRQNANRLDQLGYRWRLYAFPGQEHYGPPIQDQWGEGVRYEHSFVRDPNPPRVTYIRSMPFERAVETVQSEKVPLDFDFDHAYWMSRLTPADPAKGVARFDGRSLGIRERPHATTSELGGPGATDNTGPYVMTGQAWQPSGPAPAVRDDAYEAKLAGASAVRLDTTRMRVGLRPRLSGDLTTESPLRLELAGRWPRRVIGWIDGRRTRVRRASRGVVVVSVPRGRHRVVLGAGKPRKARRQARKKKAPQRRRPRFTG